MNQRLSAIQIALNRRVGEFRSFLTTTTVTTQSPVATHSTAERPRRVQGDWASADRYEPARHPALAGPPPTRLESKCSVLSHAIFSRQLRSPLDGFLNLFSESRFVGFLMLAGTKEKSRSTVSTQ